MLLGPSLCRCAEAGVQRPECRGRSAETEVRRPGAPQRRRLASALRALRPQTQGSSSCCCTADEEEVHNSGEFRSNNDVGLPTNHPSFKRAPTQWKNEPDYESAARFAKGGTLTATERRRLQHELQYFREHGCIMVADALSSEQLARARQAYNRVLATTRGDWGAGDPPFEPELPGAKAFELEDDLLALVDVPRLLPLLSQCVGEDLQISGVTTRYNPGGDELAPGARSRLKGAWHRDTANYHNNATGRSLALKVFINFYDVESDGGATLLVPRTHVSDIHPRTLPDAVQADMPGRVNSAGKAGSALIFDKRTWHARSVNSRPLGEARRCMTLIYETVSRRRFTS